MVCTGMLPDAAALIPCTTLQCGGGESAIHKIVESEQHEMQRAFTAPRVQYTVGHSVLLLVIIHCRYAHIHRKHACTQVHTQEKEWTRLQSMLKEDV